MTTFGTGGNNQPLVVYIRLTSEGTKNARSNVYETQISRCLDTGGNSPQSNQGGVAIRGTLNARDYKGVGNQYVAEGKLQVDKNSVRRLTPTECARLQRFPDWWCADLETENPSDEEIKFWQKVFRTVGKNKTESQIRRWLKNPHSDSAEYKMWGNGIAILEVFFWTACPFPDTDKIISYFYSFEYKNFLIKRNEVPRQFAAHNF